MNAGHVTARLPNGAHPSLAPVQRVKTADGYGQLMCMTQKFWDELCALAGRPDLAADPRFADLAARRANLPALTEAIDGLFATRTNADWTALLGGRVPFGPVNSLTEALDDLQADTALTNAVGAGLVENHIYMKRAEVDKTAGLEGDALRDWYIWYL